MGAVPDVTGAIVNNKDLHFVSMLSLPWTGRIRFTEKVGLEVLLFYVLAGVGDVLLKLPHVADGVGV
jgi:hypothetical protein